MNIINMPLEKIIPYEKNPRHNANAVDAVANSIQQFGFRQPIVVDKDHVIIAGHTRLLAARKLGLNEAPVVVADDMTPAQVTAYRLADNKVAELATWDDKLLEEELEKLAGMNIDMTLFGFTVESVPDVVREDDYKPELPDVPKARQGQIYQLGHHRLMCGDSTSIDDVRCLMNGEEADLLLTDPPYNVDYQGTAGKIKNDCMTPEQFRSFLIDAFKAADNVMKPGAAFYIWHADGEPACDFRSACRDVGWPIRQCLVWVKDKFTLSRQDYHWRHEPCLYGEKPADHGEEQWDDESEPCLYGWKDGKHYFFRNRKQSTVLNFDRPKYSREHPTMKPILLFDYQIKGNTHQGEAVLDLFGGSGTTLMACEQNGRRAFLMELDPKFVDVIIDRWEAFTGMKAVLLE